MLGTQWDNVLVMMCLLVKVPWGNLHRVLAILEDRDGVNIGMLQALMLAVLGEPLAQLGFKVIVRCYGIGDVIAMLATDV